METNTSPRKEVIHVSGLTILVVLALLADALIAGFIYRWHNWELFDFNRTQQVEYGKLLAAERAVKDEIVKLEAVPTWNDTQYYKVKGK